MRFSSKIDLWLWALITLTAAVCVAAVVMTGLQGPLVGAVTMLAICLLALALPLWVVLRTDYELAEKDLLIRSGPFRWRVPLDRIASVAPSRNWVSAPALSLQRLRIAYGKASAILISPRDPTKFLEELKRRCPAVEIAAQ